MPDQPNFLFIITDQQRADSLGCTGHPVQKTPNIDRIAASGTVFDHFYVANPVCMPNRACLMTGRMSSVNGVRQNGNDLPHHMTTFTEVLCAAGYRTALFGKSHLQTFTEMPAPIGSNPSGSGRLANAVDIGPQSSYLNESPAYWSTGASAPVLPYYGFDTADLVTFHGAATGGAHLKWLQEQTDKAAHYQDPTVQFAHGYTCPQAVRTTMPESLYSTSYIRMRACEFLQSQAQSERPFFACVSFPDPHHPFTPPGRYWDLYHPDDMVLPDNLPGDGPSTRILEWIRRQQVHRGLDALTPQYFVTGAMSLPEKELREAMALTCGMIAMIDDAVGELLGTLRDCGLDDNTIVVFTSDHGDFMGDHGMILKGGPHYQSLIRVPMIWNDPRVDQPARVDALGSTIDLAPTVIGAARAQPFHDIQGIDLSPLIGGDSLPHGRDAVLVEDDSYHVDQYGFDGQYRARTLVTRQHRMTVYLGHDRGELYDLEQDPHEITDLWEAPGAASLRESLVWQLSQRMMDYCSRSPWPKQEA